MAIATAYSIPAATVGFYACNLMEKYWDMNITTGECIN